MWKEAPNGEGSYWDPDAYEQNQRWWAAGQADRIDASLLNEDGSVKRLADSDPPWWWSTE